MSWIFADSFDLYSDWPDAVGYWDTAVQAAVSLAPGRSAGGQALGISYTSQMGSKASGANDAVHHITLGFFQNNALSGTHGTAVTLYDGATAQCNVFFRSNGDISLRQGLGAGAILDTFVGALSSSTTWYGLEIEIVINNTTGSWAVRKNGNTANDHSATGLNTRQSANNYANLFAISGAVAGASQTYDDLIWRSDPSSVAWLGDCTAYTRRPVSDQSVQWTPSAAVLPFEPYALGASIGAPNTADSYYMPFIAPCSGALNSAAINMLTALSCNVKCELFNDNSGVPGTTAAAATTTAISGVGIQTIPFGSPPSLTQGTRYWLGFAFSATGGTIAGVLNATLQHGQPVYNVLAYASFPVSNPTTLISLTAFFMNVNIAPSGVANAPFTGDFQADRLNSYVYSSTVGQADFYGLSSIAATPSVIPFVVTRGFFARNDQGDRSAEIRNKSGSVTSVGNAVALSASVWQWSFRVDAVDPNTSAGWTATAVNNLQVGPLVTA
jgi:hypothetical protein